MAADPGFDLTGRRAVVTGASTGIGAAIATRLAGAGADVVAVSRSGRAPDGVAGLAHAHLSESGDGSVVMIGSVDAIRPSGGASVYGATKAALMGITISLAREWADTGVRINQVNPGLIDTPMAADAIAGLAAQNARFNIVARPGTGDEIAAQVHYLVAPVARFATGRSFEIDGGALSLGPFTAFEEDTDG